MLERELPSNSSTPVSEQPSSESSRVRQVDLVCRTHGRFQAYVLPNQDGDIAAAQACPKCVDESAARQSSATRTRQDQQRRAEQLRRLSGLAKIPPRFATKSFADYVATADGQRYALAVCRGYASRWLDRRESGGGLVLTGSCGTGKTHLACSIANSLIADYVAAVVYATVPELSREVRETYRRDCPRTEKSVIADLMAPELLIIDEVGAHKCSEHELQLLFEIIDGRYRLLRPTILISNLTVQELHDLLGERAMERFRDGGHVVAFDWESHRGKQVSA
jgi:DNA replication protein DnaC